MCGAIVVILLLCGFIIVTMPTILFEGFSTWIGIVIGAVIVGSLALAK